MTTLRKLATQLAREHNTNPDAIYAELDAMLTELGDIDATTYNPSHLPSHAADFLERSWKLTHRITNNPQLHFAALKDLAQAAERRDAAEAELAKARRDRKIAVWRAHAIGVPVADIIKYGHFASKAQTYRIINQRGLGATNPNKDKP